MDEMDEQVDDWHWIGDIYSKGSLLTNGGSLAVVVAK